jgi:hypothetical protein
MVHWEVREAMTEADIEIILQRAKEKYPGGEAAHHFRLALRSSEAESFAKAVELRIRALNVL